MTDNKESITRTFAVSVTNGYTQPGDCEKSQQSVIDWKLAE